MSCDQSSAFGTESVLAALRAIPHWLMENVTFESCVNVEFHVRYCNFIYMIDSDWGPRPGVPSQISSLIKLAVQALPIRPIGFLIQACMMNIAHCTVPRSSDLNRYPARVIDRYMPSRHPVQNEVKT